MGKKKREEVKVTQEIDAEVVARRGAELMLEKKARDVAIMDVTGLTDIAQRFVLCSCDNDVHVKAVADHVREELADEGVRPWKTEGWEGRMWVILDFVDVVFHVFYDDTRHFYNLERLWADAPTERISDEIEQSNEESSEESEKG